MHERLSFEDANVSNKTIWVTHAVLMTVAAVFMLAAWLLADAATAEDHSPEARATLENLYSTNRAAAALGRSAYAVLVFPRLSRAELAAQPPQAFNGAYGEGTLFRGETATGSYQLVSSTWKPDAEEMMAASCVVFLMTADAEASLDKGTWTVNADAIVDRGMSALFAVSANYRDSHVFVFDQKGLVTATSLRGARVSPIRG